MSAVAAEPAPAVGMGRRVGINSLWLIGQPLLLNVVSIFSTAYIARALGAADYGAFNLGYAQIALFSPLGNLGIRAVAVRAIAQDRENAREIAGAAFALRLMLTGLAALLALCWLALPAYSLATRLIGLAAIGSMLLNSASYAAVDLFQGHERSRLAAQPQIMGGLTLTILSVVLLLAGLGLPGMVAAYLIGHVTQLVLLFRAARAHYFTLKPVWKAPRMRRLAGEARPFALLSVLSSFTDGPVVDVLLLGLLFGTGTVGPYAAAVGLVGRLLMVPHGIADAMYPAAARSEADPEASRRTVARFVFHLLLATLPLALCLSITAPTVIRILFGSEYLHAAPALRLAAWLLPLMGLTYFMRWCLAAVHEQGLVARLTLAGCLVMAAVYAVFIPVWGMTGAAAAGVVIEVVRLGLYSRPFARRFPGRPGPRECAGAALALGLMAVPLLLAQWTGSIALVVGAVLVAFPAYAGALLALGLLPRELARALRRA